MGKSNRAELHNMKVFFLLVILAVAAYAVVEERAVTIADAASSVTNLIDQLSTYRSCKSKTSDGLCIPSLLWCGHTEWQAGAYMGSVCYYVLAVRPHQSGSARGSGSGSAGSGSGSFGSGGSSGSGGISGSGAGMGAGVASSNNIRFLDWFCDCLCGFGAVEALAEGFGKNFIQF